MKAIVYTKYGPPDVLQLKEVERPAPKHGEVLIRVFAATVTKGDCEMRSRKIPNLIWLMVRLVWGLTKPKKQILGQELAGEIEAVGKDVSLFKKGDQVFGSTGARFGAYAEYACLPATYAIAMKPANLTFEEAAAIPVGGLNALHFLRKGNIQRGQKVLINGAAGSFGTLAVQLAKHFGAEVTGVDSTSKLDLLREIGADQVIDYTKEDFTERDETYDMILDMVCRIPLSRMMRSLKPNGRYLLTNPAGLFQMLRGLWISFTGSKKVILELAREKPEDLVFLKELVEAGMLRPVIDRCYPLEQTAEAHRYVETGQKRGNVVITLERNNKS
ncbi:NAD(P)-dependent alcohol dehydrogenase [Candidatus Parcubacteria bacterium]|nr:MAG: NAD(P)-dependent alcohol dehydrogenase [Candidatus Parcubacteria bacterium]